MSDKPLTVREYAELMRVHTDFVYAAVKKGQVPVIRIGRQIRILPSAAGQAA